MQNAVSNWFALSDLLLTSSAVFAADSLTKVTLPVVPSIEMSEAKKGFKRNSNEIEEGLYALSILPQKLKNDWTASLVLDTETLSLRYRKLVKLTK